MAVENLCAPLSLLLPGAHALLRTLIIFASEILSTTNSYDNFLREGAEGVMSGQTSGGKLRYLLGT